MSSLIVPFGTTGGAYLWLWGLAAVMACLLIVGALYLLWRHQTYAQQPVRARQALSCVLLVIAGLSAVSYFYGSRSGGSWVHRWDMFHTVIATKYQEELGYFGLYECSLALDREHNLMFRDVRRVRDLETHKIHSIKDVLSGSYCAARFSPERKAAFLADLAVFDELGVRWKSIFSDKGYNGMPSHTAMQRLLWTSLPVSYTSMFWMAQLDVILILLSLGVLWRTFGLNVMLVAGLCFFANFPGRFTHMGGSVLRFDYVVALMLSMAALKTGRHALAGGLIGYSVMSRFFPLTFACAYLLHAGFQCLRERAVPKAAIRFVAGLGAVGGAFFLFSLWMGGGVESWAAWLHNMQVHSSKTAGFRVGFPHMFMMQGNLQGPDGFVGFWEKARSFAEHKYWWLLIAAAWLGLASWWARKLDVLTFTAAIGLLAFFLAMVATRYYYAVLVVLVLLGADLSKDRGYMLLLGCLFAVFVAGFWAMFTNGFSPWVYNTVVSGSLTVYFVLLTIWLRFGTHEVAEVAALPEKIESLASPRQSV